MATNDSDIKDHSRQVKIASSTNAILGVWLMVSPWVFGYVVTARNTAWNSIVVGLLIVIFGSLRYRSPHHLVVLSWANFALGAWTVLSPWIYSYTSDVAPLWNSVIAGLVVLALAVWSGSATATEHRHRLA
jgi:SPW repeat